MVLLCLMPVVSGAQSIQPASAPDEAAAKAEAPPRLDGRRTMRRLPASLGWTFAGIFAKDSLPPAVVGAMATGVAGMLDTEVRDSLGNEDSAFGQGGDAVGHGATVDIVAVTLFAAGRLSDNQRFRDFSYDVLPAVLVTQVTTGAIKAAVGRTRPNLESDRVNSSFPSGHSSGTFALATVVERHFGWKGAIPAYTVSSLVALSRVRYNRHYLSDVVAGSALGIIIGRAAVRMNSRPLPGASGRASVSFSPLGTRGVQVAVVFSP